MPDRHHEQLHLVGGRVRTQDDPAYWGIFLIVLIDLALWAAIGYGGWQLWQWWHR